MVKSLHARLVAYQPGGAKLGILQAPLGFDASIIHNDLGALKVTYSRRAVGGGILQRGLEAGLEIGLEVSDGGAWTEPFNCRYLLIGRSRNAEDVSDTVTLTCQSMAWLGNKILNNDTAHLITDGDNKGKRAFLSKNPGVIIRTILDENTARRGAGTVLAAGFDTGKDAGGAAWKNVYTLYYSLGTSLNSMLSSMVGGGAIDWRTDKRALRLWNADSTNLSRDLSNQVHVSMMHDVLEAPEEESIEDLSSDILVEGDNGLIFRESNAAAPTPWGKWESYVSQGGVSDEATAKAFMQATLASSARVRGQYTRSLLVSNAESLPLIDYRPGDWITAPTVKHGEKVRIQQVTLSLDSGGLKASITLNDKVYDSQVRQAKKIQGITGGATLAGSEGGRPAPEKDHRTPKPVTGLVVATDAYISSRGTALGLATLQWAKVEQATDNTAIDISSYRVEYRKNTAGAPWQNGGVTAADAPTIGIGGLECGVEYAFRVRAVPTYSDRLGEWSNVAVALVASDVTPPSVPSKPILTSKLGVVDVEWDGKNNAGGGMESDFDHVEVGISNSNGNWTYRDNLARDGHCIVTGLEYRQYWFALRSVDHSGNKSQWGAGASVTVASAVSQEDLDQIDKDVAANKQAIADANKTLVQAQSDITANKGAISEANKQITANKTAIDKASQQLTQAQSDIKQAQADSTKAKTDAADAKSEAAKATGQIEQARADITAASSKAQTALDKANSVGKSLDGLHNVFEGPDDPTTLSGVTVKQGDFWYKTQKYWTRWSGDENNSTSLLADFYTYWTGEANNSTSVLVPLSSRFTGVYVYDGSAWQERNLVAANILATGSVVADNMAANSITTEKIVAGAITTDRIAANAIVSGKIAAGAISTDKLAALAVTADKLAANSVVAGKLAANSVNAGNIVAGAITADKLAANSVNASKIVSGSITADKLAANSVTTDKLAANSVNASKIVAQSITGDKIASNTIVARNIAAQSITSDRIAAGQFVGYVFTGSIFQSSTADNTGWKLKGNALSMWDSAHNRTVYLDGEGGNNVLTGTFQTAFTGQRVKLSPTFNQSEIGGTDRLTGPGIQFYHATDAAEHPYIAVESTTQEEGEVSALVFNGGQRDSGALGRGHGYGAFGRVGMRRDDQKRQIATVYFSASADYAHANDTDRTQREWNSSVRLSVPDQSDTTARIAAEAPDSRSGGVYANVSQNYTNLFSQNAAGWVGVQANIGTGYLYLGGYLGGLTSWPTFNCTHWRAWSGGTSTAPQRYGDVKYTFTAPRTGIYRFVASADAGTDQALVHTAYTTSSSVTVLGWGNYGVDVYASVMGYLTKS
ncbi:hypothetical protein [Bifidobacterium scaligerum]|uniref:hypothetical protein n=1 Tax=Bifidobacterium scaligerum TaxID=2052656 RepID=UPI001FAE97F4|nr:hypothetical protein [Bifidobacterium scaligerum]